MTVIGITGGIGCGKSYVSARMQLRGIPVYDSDSRAKLITSTDQSVKDALSELVGPDPDNMAKVDAIVHPRVRDDFRRWAAGLKNKEFCIIESAILFESGFDSEAGFTVCVDAPLQLRIERCVKRDNTTAQSVVARINSQMEQVEKCRLADYVIVNDNVTPLEPQIDALLLKCKETFIK